VPAQALPTISERFGAPAARIARRLSSRTWEVNVVDPTSDPDWDTLVASHPDSTFFHSAAWTKVLCKTYGHKPASLLVSKDGEPVVLVPLLEISSPLTGRRGVCLPFTDFSEPLFFRQCDSGMVHRLLCELASSRKWKFFEIRGENMSSKGTSPSITFYGHALDLRSGPEALFSGFDSSVRRSIRKAQRSHLEFRVSHSEESIRCFYEIHARTRRRHGLPPQPISFFLNIYDLIIRSGSGFVALVLHGEQPVAGALFFHRGSRAIYKFGASNERFQHLRPNNLLFWESIRSLAGQGIENLHLGRTSIGNEGLRRFKLSWGSSEQPVSYFRFDSRTDSSITTRDNASGFHNAAFARLPLFVNRLIGAMMYPHLD
jgi:CelD/BcsL family acetyltransferase involved in cellulose biosynthesis